MEEIIDILSILLSGFRGGGYTKCLYTSTTHIIISDTWPIIFKKNIGRGENHTLNNVTITSSQLKE